MFGMSGGSNNPIGAKPVLFPILELGHVPPPIMRPLVCFSNGGVGGSGGVVGGVGKGSSTRARCPDSRVFEPAYLRR